MDQELIGLSGYMLPKPTTSRLILHSTAAPTTGTYNQGDIVFNSAPVAGGNMGWVCVVAGTPGTWKSFGTIAA